MFYNFKYPMRISPPSLSDDYLKDKQHCLKQIVKRNESQPLNERNEICID